MAWTHVFVTVDRRREQPLAEAARYHTPWCWTLFSVTLLCTVCSENTSSITLRCHERSSKTNGPKVVLPQLKSSCDRDQRCRLGFKHFITSRLTAADRRRHFSRGQRKRTHPKRPESKPFHFWPVKGRSQMATAPTANTHPKISTLSAALGFCKLRV